MPCLEDWELQRWAWAPMAAHGAGREVLRMYARLRGVPRDLREGLAVRLLERLSLTPYADR